MSLFSYTNSCIKDALQQSLFNEGVEQKIRYYEPFYKSVGHSTSVNGNGRNFIDETDFTVWYRGTITVRETPIDDSAISYAERWVLLKITPVLPNGFPTYIFRKHELSRNIGTVSFPDLFHNYTLLPQGTTPTGCIFTFDGFRIKL